MSQIVPRGEAFRGEHVQLDLVDVGPDETATVSAPDGTEAALVLLAGEGTLGGRAVSRADVFTEPATAAYLPPGSSIDVVASTAMTMALAATVGGELHAPTDAQPTLVTPSEVVVHERGQPGWQREVHDVIADGVPAQRLLVGETFNRAGQWSSFPPHKHDGGDGEPALEEVYYYRFQPSDGFGFQGLYEENGPDRAVFLRHGAVVGIPRGYHPVCAAPGYRLYYLWALSAAPNVPRALALHEDPAHRWLHDIAAGETSGR